MQLLQQQLMAQQMMYLQQLQQQSNEIKLHLADPNKKM